MVNLTLLVPGTGQDTARVKRPNASVGAAIGTASTNFLVDGVPNVTAKTAEPRSDIPQAGVREFAVHTSQQPAQYGWRPGGTVSIVTKSGTNTFSGEAFEFFRNQAMTRLDKFAQAAVDAGQGDEPKYSRNQWGGAVGGPIVKNKLHFFGTYERTDEHAYFTVSAPAQFYGSFNGSFRGGFAQDLSMFRVDYQMTPNQNVMFRYLNEHTLFFCNGCGGTASNFSAGDEFIPRYTTAGTPYLGHRQQHGERDQLAVGPADRHDGDEQGFHPADVPKAADRARRRHAGLYALRVSELLVGLRAVPAALHAEPGHDDALQGHLRVALDQHGRT